MAEDRKKGKLGLVLRVGVFAFLALAGGQVFYLLIYLVADVLIAATLGTFAAAAVATAMVLRIYERGRLADIGMHWSAASRRNLLVGVAGGVGAGILMLGPPLLMGFAELRLDPDYPASWAAFGLVSFVLLFGAIGEELLFRGYGFQILIAGIGPFATILPVSVLFAVSHSGNYSMTGLGDFSLAFFNTVGWGVLLGIAVLRSGDLWLPIGLHFGWNWVLPVFGVGLSGYKLGTTGYAMHWNISDVWSGGAYGPEGGILTSFVLIVLGLYLWKAPIEGQSAFLLRSRKED